MNIKKLITLSLITALTFVSSMNVNAAPHNNIHHPNPHPNNIHRQIPQHHHHHHYIKPHEVIIGRPIMIHHRPKTIIRKIFGRISIIFL